MASTYTVPGLSFLKVKLNGAQSASFTQIPLLLIWQKIICYLGKEHFMAFKILQDVSPVMQILHES